MNGRFGLSIAVAFIAIILVAWPALATTYYVNGTIGDDTNDGARSTPWRTVSHALENIGNSTASNPARLEVSSGNYSAAANGESFPLVMHSYLTIVGMGPESTVLDGGQSSPHVIFAEGVVSAVIEGIALTGGKAEGDWPDSCGGGICAIDSDITIRNSKMYTNNAAGIEKHGAGAGIYLYGDCSPAVEDCEFVINVASTGGAGICVEYYCKPTITGCKFDRNTGAAIQVLRWAEAAISNCSITENTGGVVLEDFSTAVIEESNIARNNSDNGAAVKCSHHCEVTIQSCTLWSNVVTGDGGAVSCEREGVCNIIDCEISLNTSGQSGGGISSVGSSLLLLDSSISSNSSRGEGGGVFCGQDSTAIIENSDIAGNDAPWGAGIAFCDNAAGDLTSCNFMQNDAESGGGAVFCRDYSSPRFMHCELQDNAVTGESPMGGGAFYSEYFCDLELINSLVTSNETAGSGGAFFFKEYCEPVLKNVTAWDNIGKPSSIYCDGCCELVVENCIIWGGEEGIAALDESAVEAYHSCIFGGHSGTGSDNIDQDPRFATAPDQRGDYYLSSLAAKQSEDSPCIDGGYGLAEYSEAGLSFRTTRTDRGFDSGDIDMGYHYPADIPNIRCYLNSTEYRIGDTFSLSIRVSNPADTAKWADIYVAIVMSSGEIFCIGTHGLTYGISAMESDYNMPAGHLFGPEMIVQTLVPGGCPTGTYLAVGALFEPGTMTEISEMSLVEFEMN
ncbi:MAG: right-handed parallel beta-helix repeat-containing protein [Candidatus Coatesbacteria bacterium]|nr:right-handed parallel beta-helix repeat-containing protein [Candidatus Coatesbacteria bacterium]